MSDIQLIWDNCKTYNVPESVLNALFMFEQDIYKTAQYMEQLSRKTAEKLRIFCYSTKRERDAVGFDPDLEDEFPPEDSQTYNATYK